MIFWLIIFFIGGTVFGFGLHCILTSSKVSELYAENDKLKLKLSATESAVKTLKENLTYTTYSNKI